MRPLISTLFATRLKIHSAVVLTFVAALLGGLTGCGEASEAPAVSAPPATSPATHPLPTESKAEQNLAQPAAAKPKDIDPATDPRNYPQFSVKPMNSAQDAVDAIEKAERDASEAVEAATRP